MRNSSAFSRTAVAVAALAAVAVSAPAAARPASAARQAGCSDAADEVRPLKLLVDGELATGRYAVPSEPTGLVVFAHGYGHTSYSWDAHMLEAARHGLIAVAMDYRGLVISPDSNDDGLPESRGWPAMAGAEDSIAAARLFESACDVETVTILGVSMGGNMSGLAVALVGERGITTSDGDDALFDYWVDVEGVANVIETYAGARALAGFNTTARNALEDIEAEMGGPIEEEPNAYLERSVVARIDDVAAAGLDGAVVVHGLDDGLVPYNQGREMSVLLRGAGIPTEMLTVGLRDEDSERETTLTGHVAGAVYPDYTSPLAGHASEKSTTHIVMQTSLERMWALAAGETPSDRECMVNGQVPPPAGRVCAP